MLIGIPKESAIGERRVATSPDAATQLPDTPNGGSIVIQRCFSGDSMAI